MTKSLAFLLLGTLISSCVYGPKAERKTTLSYLNGENYETTAQAGSDAAVIPIVKRKEKATQIDGVVLTGEGVAATPVKNLSVTFYDAKKKVLKNIFTDEDGRFSFSTQLKNGEYLAKITDDKYAGQTTIDVNSYKPEAIVIKALPK